jgi:hypothetical protein
MLELTTDQSATPLSPGVSDEESEAYQELLELCRRKTGSIPEPLLVRHVLAVTRGTDWPVQRAALDALLRRLDAADKERLQLATRPAAGKVLGAYETSRRGKGGGVRPYTTLLEAVAPPAGRCNCPDFGKSSLGLCKHLLTLLSAIYKRPRKLALALREQRLQAPIPARLIFDPVRPFTGRGDLLMQVRWQCGAVNPSQLAEGKRARRWFCAGQSGILSLKESHEEQPHKRLTLVSDLLAFMAHAPSARQDPTLLGLLEQERERLQRVLKDAPLQSDLKQRLATLKCPLYPYQVEGLSRFLSSGRLLLADDMGLGKTAQAIAACHVLWHAGRVRRGLLIVPASLKPQWLREWQHFSDAPASVIDGSRTEREAAYKRNEDGFLIVNYEQLLRDLPFIQGLRPQIVVLDEAQRIKNWATKTAASVKTLDAPYRLVLTGTPMENRLPELASILDWVEPRAIEPKWRLSPWHTYSEDNGASGARNLDTLRQRLSGCLLRRVRQEVLKQLPARTDTRVPVEMTAQQREEHDALNQPIAQLIAILRRRPLSPAQHIRLMSLLTTQRIISNGLGQLRFLSVWPALSEAAEPTQALREGLFAPKLEALRELITHLVADQGRKVVVFSQWRRMLRLASWALRDILQAAGARAVFFTGAEAAGRRTQNIVEFHDDPNTRVMFLTDAGGVGLNLQRAASGCINLELPWNPAVLEQRISRIYRIGQKQPIDVYNLVTEEGIESRIADLIGTKKALFTGLFDGDSNEIRFDQAGSFLAKMEQLLPAAMPAESTDGDADEGEESSAADGEIAQLLHAADETQDAETAAADGAPPKLVFAPQPDPIREAPSLEAPARSSEDRSPPSIVSEESVRRLFGEVHIRRTDQGGLAIEASPAAAGTLAALFQGLAGLLSMQSQP